jgi:ribonuclease R
MKKEIKAYFKNHPSLKIKAKDLAKKMEITEEYAYSELKHVLYSLTEEGYLIKEGKRYQIKGYDEGRLTGILQIVGEGDYGFVMLKDKRLKDVFVAGKKLGTAFDGDQVEIVLVSSKKGKSLEGEIVRIIQRKREEVVGILQKGKSFFFVKPDDNKIHRDIRIQSGELKDAKPGDKVVIDKIEWRSPQDDPEGHLKEILGKAGLYDTEIASIAREFGITYKFPKEVSAQAEAISETIPVSEIKKRIDLRSKNIFTIDPEDAKDFDDAVSVELLPNGNHMVGIHIADVSHYVRAGSPIYEEALNRGTSVYLVGKVIPMLPEKLSNIICSLVPGKDRLTYSVMVEIAPDFKVITYEIGKTVINSKRRFTYDEVQEIIDKGKGDFGKEIAILNNIAKNLRLKRMKKGSINFFSPEVVFKLDKFGTPVEIAIKEIRESHNLIEEFMLLANQIIAGEAKPKGSKKNMPFIFRIHDFPDKEKITEFARFVRSLGYHFDPESANNSKQFQQLLEQVKGTEEEAVINEVAIRSMAKAVYSTKNIGHYGLGFRYYTHFTSPIRRFPDLAVHQLIWNYAQNSQEKNLSLEELEEISNHASAKERNAVSAERLSVKLKQIEYLKSKLGEEFHGIVSGITHFGIFIELNQTLAEGLIRLRDMDDDYYVLDEKNYSINGRRSGRRIRLGDKVNVRLVRVDEEKREIDFVLLD